MRARQQLSLYLLLSQVLCQGVFRLTTQCGRLLWLAPGGVVHMVTFEIARSVLKILGTCVIYYFCINPRVLDLGVPG